MYTPIEQETSIVKNAIFEAYVKYGMNVFEYEHTEKERIREEETDEVSLEQAQGVIHKKDHTEQERRIMTLSVCSGGTTGRRDRNYNRMELTVKRGWDQYLSEAQEVQSPVPVIATAATGVAVTVGQRDNR
jgi:hypothetical protein